MALSSLHIALQQFLGAVARVDANPGTGVLLQDLLLGESVEVNTLALLNHGLGVRLRIGA